MSSTPVPGFITKTEATENFQRSHRQLTRDLAVAMRMQNPKVLEHCRLRTEDGQLREGIGLNPDVIDTLRMEGKNPVWYLRTTWLEKNYGRRGHVPRSAATRALTGFSARADSSSTLPSSDLVQALEERIRGLERDKERFHEEMKIKNQQIMERAQREKETNSLIRDLHTLMGDMQQRLLPPPTPRVSETREASYIPVDPAQKSSAASEPQSAEPAIEVRPSSPSPRPEKDKVKDAPSKPAPNEKQRRSMGKIKAKVSSAIKTKPKDSKPIATTQKRKGFWAHIFPL